MAGSTGRDEVREVEVIATLGHWHHVVDLEIVVPQKVQRWPSRRSARLRALIHPALLATALDGERCS